MKKGCFLKFIIIFTIVLAAALYIIQNKFNEYFLNPGKELTISILENEWKDNLDYVNDTPEKDSLNSLLKFYINKLKSTKDAELDKTKIIIDMVEESFVDSIIEKYELSKIAELIKTSSK